MEYLVAVFNLAAAVSSGLAAYYWFLASMVGGEPPRRTQQWPIPPLPTSGADADPLLIFWKESGRRNKVAALWTGAAALCVALSAISGLLAPYLPR